MSIMRIGAAALLAALLAVGCGKAASSTPQPASAPLAGFASQRLIVTPAGFVRQDTSAWGRAGAPVTTRAFDSTMAAVLEARGLAQGWILPTALATAYERNRTYAADPHRLALQSLRASAFATGQRLAEPLASQLRTMIALHEDARLVLVPVELWFEPLGATARGVLKLALVDPRFSQANWVGTVEGTAAASPRESLASVASRVADLFLAP